jgi:hypothetical protein
MALLRSARYVRSTRPSLMRSPCLAGVSAFVSADVVRFERRVDSESALSHAEAVGCADWWHRRFCIHSWRWPCGRVRGHGRGSDGGGGGNAAERCGEFGAFGGDRNFWFTWHRHILAFPAELIASLNYVCSATRTCRWLPQHLKTISRAERWLIGVLDRARFDFTRQG